MLRLTYRRRDCQPIDGKMYAQVTVSTHLFMETLQRLQRQEYFVVSITKISTDRQKLDDDTIQMWTAECLDSIEEHVDADTRFILMSKIMWAICQAYEAGLYDGEELNQGVQKCPV